MGKLWVKQAVHSQNVTIYNKLAWGSKSALLFPQGSTQDAKVTQEDVGASVSKEASLSSWCGCPQTLNGCLAPAPFGSTPRPTDPPGKDCCRDAQRPCLEEAVQCTEASSWVSETSVPMLQSRCRQGRHLHAASSSPCDNVHPSSSWTGFS